VVSISSPLPLPHPSLPRNLRCVYSTPLFQHQSACRVYSSNGRLVYVTR
jgi:hypothetical protein